MVKLPWGTSWQDLKDFFRKAGEVERTEVPSYPDGKSRGFGIVRFVNADDARKAIGKFYQRILLKLLMSLNLNNLTI